MVEFADELPRVTTAHLRRAEEMCPRRLAGERRQYRGSVRNRPADARFAVRNRLEADARLAHATARALGPGDFPVPGDLSPEEQLVYRAGATGYLLLFGDEPARAVDEEILDPFATELEDFGVRLGATVGIPLTLGDDTAVLRRIRFGPPGFGRPALDDVDLHVAALRTTTWLPRGMLRIVTADLLALRVQTVELDLDAARPAAIEFLTDRLGVIDGIAARPVAQAGEDCNGCGFVAGCRWHQR